MSDPAEKTAAIAAAVEAAKKRLSRIDALRTIGAATKAQEYERDMCIELIQRGEKLLLKKPDPSLGPRDRP